MFKSQQRVSALTVLTAAALLSCTTGCDPLVKGASDGLIAAAEYLITTPVQFWVDESLMNNTAE